MKVIYKKITKDKKVHKKDNISKNEHARSLKPKRKKQKKKTEKKHIRIKRQNITFEKAQINQKIRKTIKRLRELGVSFDYGYDLKKLQSLLLKHEIEKTKKELMKMNVIPPDDYDLKKLKNLLIKTRNREMLLKQARQRKIQPSIGTLMSTYDDDK